MPEPPAERPDRRHIYDPTVRALLEQVGAGDGGGEAGSPLGRDTAVPADALVGPDGLPAPFYRRDDLPLTLYQGDALDLLRRLPPASFDLIFADPPYFLSGDGITCQAGKRVSVKKGEWDTPLSFEEMHAFNREWLSLCRALLTPDGSLWVTGTYHNIFSVGFALQTLGFKVLNDIAWHKVNPPPNLACRYFTHATETCLWARRDARGRHTFDYAAMKRENGGKQMQSLWRIPPPTPWEKRHGKHPTQKPERLLDRIVRAASRPGDRILDPFCGSGTTGVVCARLGRPFVGIEREAEYLRVAVLRIVDEAGPVQLVFTFPPIGERETTEEARTDGQAARTPWNAVVVAALEELGGEADLYAINQAVARRLPRQPCRTWTSTVRRVVRQYPCFEPVRRGRYKLRATASH